MHFGLNGIEQRDILQALSEDLPNTSFDPRNLLQTPVRYLSVQLGDDKYVLIEIEQGVGR